jgi:hypothetical protein
MSLHPLWGQQSLSCSVYRGEGVGVNRMGHEANNSLLIQCLLLLLWLFSRHNSTINTPCLYMYYMFRPTVTIIRWRELLQSHYMSTWSWTSETAFAIKSLTSARRCRNVALWNLLRQMVHCRFQLYWGREIKPHARIRVQRSRYNPSWQARKWGPYHKFKLQIRLLDKAGEVIKFTHFMWSVR